MLGRKSLLWLSSRQFSSHGLKIRFLIAENFLIWRNFFPNFSSMSVALKRIVRAGRIRQFGEKCNFIKIGIIFYPAWDKVSRRLRWLSLVALLRRFRSIFWISNCEICQKLKKLNLEFEKLGLKHSALSFNQLLFANKIRNAKFELLKYWRAAF